MNDGLKSDAVFSGTVAADDAGGVMVSRTVETPPMVPQNGPMPVITDEADFRPEPPWMPVARREMGQLEILGKEHNPRIIQYHATTGLKATSDEVPWCSSYVNWVMTKTQMERTNSAAAKSWADWGYGLEKPIYGAVVVLTRPGGNHVGFFVGEDKKGNYILLSGNAANSVNESVYPKSKVFAIRWPHGFAEKDFRARN